MKLYRLEPQHEIPCPAAWRTRKPSTESKEQHETT